MRALVYSRLWLQNKNVGALVLGLVLPALAVVGLVARHEPAAVAAARAPTLVQALTPSVEAPVIEAAVAPLPGALPAPERLSDADFARSYRSAPSELGSLSLGLPNRGFLFNPSELKDTEEWRIVNPKHAFATRETALALRQAVHEVNVRFDGTERLAIGDLSDVDGGWISPHKSHQSGRDVDLGLYYSDGSKWYTKATPLNLDTARTWALVVAMYRTGILEYVFFDRGLHDSLRTAAERAGTEAAIVECVFEGCPKAAGPILRHARGHRTHMHVRFSSPSAVANGLRAKGLAGKAGARSAGLLAQLKWQARRADGSVAEGTASKGRSATKVSRTTGGSRARATTKSKSVARKRG